MEKDNVKVVCEYLTGRITKESFISEYKRQVTDSYESSYSDNNHLACVIQDVLKDGGENLQNYARENDFDAKMRLDLRIVDKNICKNKLADALLDIGYSPKENGIGDTSRESGFPGYNINIGRPAERAISTFMHVSWDDGIGDIIEKKLGRTRATIGNYEVMRNNISQCEHCTDVAEKRALSRNSTPNTK
ncbi:MAG: hypothetical protein IKN67_03685 [Alphaproteobacteria bacterium]|nr:hypothetical protein [Alphaproteobacteria bacterium]